MTQANLDRAVARATGESVERIRRIGFSLLSGPKQPQQRLRYRPVACPPPPRKAS